MKYLPYNVHCNTLHSSYNTTVHLLWTILQITFTAEIIKLRFLLQPAYPLNLVFFITYFHKVNPLAARSRRICFNTHLQHHYKSAMFSLCGFAECWGKCYGTFTYLSAMIQFIQAECFSQTLVTAPIFMCFRNIAKSNYQRGYVCLSICLCVCLRNEHSDPSGKKFMFPDVLGLFENLSREFETFILNVIYI